MSNSPATTASISDIDNIGQMSSSIASIGDMTQVSTRSTDDSINIQALASTLNHELRIEVRGHSLRSDLILIMDKNSEDDIEQDPAVAKLDAGLEKVVQSERANPFANFKCAWEFQPDLSEIPNPPKIKKDFAKAVKDEIAAVRVIQKAMIKYATEINSKNHDFSDEFLEFETTATIVACGQLEDVRRHLIEIAKEVEGIGPDDVEVAAEFHLVYSHAQPWIVRCRQIIKQNHCSYKINYGLCVGK